MSLGPIEFDNTRATFTADLSTGGVLTVQGSDESHIHGRLVCDRTDYVSLSTAGEIRCEDDILVLKQGDSQGGRVIIYDGSDVGNHTRFLGGNISTGQNPGIQQYGDQRPFDLLAGAGQVRTNELSANKFQFRDVGLISAAGSNVSQLVIDNNTGEVQKSQASGVLPGTITPYYGHLAKNDGTRVDHATVALSPGDVYYAWDDNTGAYDTGWGLCNGATYGSYVSPNLLGRTIVGVGQADIDSSISGGDMTTRAMSGTGGVDTLSLSPSALPDHSHRYHDQQPEMQSLAQLRRTDLGSFGAVMRVQYALTNNAGSSVDGIYLNEDNSKVTTTRYTGSNPTNSIGGIFQKSDGTNSFTQVRDADEQGAPFEMSSAYYTLYYLIKLPD